jgi:hypothetical protein
LAHAGSASIASGFIPGGFPSKVTVPVTVEAAKAAPGEIDNASSPAMKPTVFPVQRILGSLIKLVIAKRVSAAVDSPKFFRTGRLYYLTRHPRNP